MFQQDLKKDIFGYYTITGGNHDQIEFIYLMYNNIIKIEPGSFSDFKNLRNINLGVNLIESISKNYFDGVDKIEFLNFQSNRIHFIEQSAFSNLRFLEYIYLDDNCLTEIADNLFLHTPRIRNIFLQHNHISGVSRIFMHPNQKLFGLNVADNQLHDISNLFRFKGLTALIVSNNKLNPINPDAISDESGIVSLNIDNTTISNVNFVRKLGKLRELYASHNGVKSVDAQKLKGAENLTYISLQGNPLEKMFLEEVNEALPNLAVLDITNSPIETNCFYLLEMYNLANEKSLNLNINETALSACLEI